MFKWFSFLLILWFLYIVREVFPPFIIGGIIAYLLLPLVKQISSSCGIKNHLSVLAIYSSVVIIFCLVLMIFGHSIAEQFQALFHQRKEIIGNLLNQITSTFQWQIDIDKSTDEIVTSVEESFGRPEEIMHLGSLLSKGFLATLVTVVSSIYFMLDSSRVGTFFLRFIPESKQESIVQLISQMNSMLSKYVRGQLLLIVIMASIAYVFLHFVIHLKYALIISIISGFFEIIPVLGPILATTSATVVGISQLGIHTAVWIILFYTLARWVEDYIVVPRIIGHAVELHPLAVIFAVLCGEVLAGGLGMLIAIPVAASIKLALDFYYPTTSNNSEPTTNMPTTSQS